MPQRLDNAAVKSWEDWSGESTAKQPKQARDGRRKVSLLRRPRRRRHSAGPGNGPRNVDISTKSSPTQYLIASLGSHGRHYQLDRRYQIKLDLSYHDAMKANQPSSRRGLPPTGANASPQLHRKRLHGVLAEYMKSQTFSESGSPIVARESPASSGHDGQLMKAFDANSLGLLSEKGYGVEDVVTWAWILRAPYAEQAAARLWAFTNPGRQIQSIDVPVFVYLFLLRRPDWSPAGVKLMLAYAWTYFGGRHDRFREEDAARAVSWPRKHWGKSVSDETPRLQIREVTLTFIRLLRHARKVLPEACISIATLLSKTLTRIIQGKQRGVTDGHRCARLTFLCNSALSLLSHPSSVRPFLSIAHQQRAQFIILRVMNEFDPPLAVDREGYRAITRVQLAHRKTMQEADWAAMKLSLGHHGKKTETAWIQRKDLNMA